MLCKNLCEQSILNNLFVRATASMPLTLERAILPLDKERSTNVYAFYKFKLCSPPLTIHEAEMHLKKFVTSTALAIKEWIISPNCFQSRFFTVQPG